MYVNTRGCQAGVAFGVDMKTEIFKTDVRKESVSISDGWHGDVLGGWS